MSPHIEVLGPLGPRHLGHSFQKIYLFHLVKLASQAHPPIPGPHTSYLSQPSQPLVSKVCSFTQFYIMCNLANNVKFYTQCVILHTKCNFPHKCSFSQ